MKFAIIGGGITGLSCAYLLLKEGHSVSIFERENRAGGLIRDFKINGAPLEIFYHHFFKTDKYLIEMLKDLDLEKNVMMRQSSIGFLHGNKIYNFNSGIDLLKFSPINLLDRIRFGISILYFRKKKNWHSLENIPIKIWVKKYLGNRVYEVIWKPLLINKFGEDYENISSAWLWGRLNPRSQSRNKGKEELGYIKGSFGTITQELISKIKKNGGKIIFEEVKKIKSLNHKIIVKTKINNQFDRVIFAAPTSILPNIVDLPEEYQTNLKKIKYKAILCTILELKHNLSNIYWMNVVDKGLPFGGIIEHTNLVPKELYNGSHIVYLFNYLSTENPLYKMPEQELLELYKKNLKKIFPRFNDDWIISHQTFRNSFATPVYSLNYSKIIPNFKTPIKHLYLANTAQIYPQDRNTSNCIKIAKQVCQIALSDN